MTKRLNNKAFTLIELLIVIVIIGILAAVLIAVIDPAAQQNRAKDASIQSALNKFALSAGAYNSSYGTYPDAVQYLGSLTGVTAQSCASGNTCLYSMDSLTLASTCDSGGYAGASTSSSQCYFYYTTDGTTFDIYARSYGASNSVFRYDSADSKIHLCAGTNATCTNPIGG